MPYGRWKKGCLGLWTEKFRAFYGGSVRAGRAPGEEGDGERQEKMRRPPSGSAGEERRKPETEEGECGDDPCSEVGLHGEKLP
jgi:hypothetical protein